MLLSTLDLLPLGIISTTNTMSANAFTCSLVGGDAHAGQT